MSGCLVLVYHRTAELDSDPNWLSVRPSNFTAHLEILRKIACPIGGSHLLEGLSSGHVPRRSVLITFDDGYADNLHVAAPILDRFGVPAVSFITTDFIGARREFPWDELERILLRQHLPPLFVFERRRWEFAPVEQDTSAIRRWHVKMPVFSPRHDTFRQIVAFARGLNRNTRERFLEKLRRWAEVPAEARPTHLPMTTDEIRMLRDRGIEVGAHAQSHSPLSELTAADQGSEIERSKRELEGIIGAPVRSFAYPHGLYTSSTMETVAQAGYSCAFTTFADLVCPGANPFRLPRLLVRDWAPDEFRQKITRWLG